jgi:hypothetical protein
LTTVSYPWVSSLLGKIELETVAKGPFVDISFEYCFVDTYITSFSNGKVSLIINDIEYWNTGFTNQENSSCDKPILAKICNIPINESDTIHVKLSNNLIGLPI